MKFLFTLASFALALGILIVIHELGHFLIARLAGVKVLRFSIGFGRPLFVRKLGTDQTEWAISAFPLGGYVKMLDEREGPVEPQELSRAFNRQSVFRRIAIVIAGPVANLLLALLLYWVLFLHGVPGVKPVLGDVPGNTAASAAGFKQNEMILRINQKTVATWQDVRWTLLQLALGKTEATVEVENGKGELDFHHLDLSGLKTEDLDRDFLEQLGLTHFHPQFQAKIGEILPEGAAARAGLLANDEVTAINGAPVAGWDDLVKWVRAHPGKALQFSVNRHGQTSQLVLVPDSVKEQGKIVGKIGAGPWIDQAQLNRLLTVIRYPPLRGLEEAARKTWDTSWFSLKMLLKMVTGEVSWKNISGPITIADFAGQSAQLGWLPYLSFLALISISLGVLNLLPIPVLDGGHLLYYMVEIIKGSPVSDKAMEIGQQVGIALLLILMAFAFYNDINRLLTG